MGEVPRRARERGYERDRGRSREIERDKGRMSEISISERLLDAAGWHVKIERGLKANPTQHLPLWTGRLDDDEIPGQGLYYGLGTSIDTMGSWTRE